MAGPAFDPNGAIRFDLKTGTAADAKGDRLVLVPAAAIDALERTAPILGREVGKACGMRVAARLGGETGVRAAQLEVVVSHLAGELALAGLGAVHIERWGKAMVCVVTNPSVASDSFLAAAIGAAVGAATGRDAAAAPIGRDGPRAKFFVGAPATAEDVAGAIGQGQSWSDVLASLHGGAA